MTRILAIALLIAPLVALPARAEERISLSLLLSWFEERSDDPVAGQGIEIDSGEIFIYALTRESEQTDEVIRPVTPEEEAAVGAAVLAMVGRVTTRYVPLPAEPAVTVEWSVGSGALFERGALVVAADDLPPEVQAVLPLMGGAWAP